MERFQLIYGDDYGVDTDDDGVDGDGDVDGVDDSDVGVDDDGDVDGVDDDGGVDAGGDDGVGLVVFLSWHPLLLIECSSCD